MQINSRSCRGIVALFVCAIFLESRAAAERTYAEGICDGGRLDYEGEVPILYLSGSPADIGRQQAALVTGSLRPLLSTPRKMLEQHGVGVAWPLIVRGAKHMFDAAPRRYREELEATSKSAGLNDDELGALYVANAMVELRRMGGCSGLVVLPQRSATGELIFGRNLDYPNVAGLDRLGMVIACRPEGKHAFAAVGYPGMVGVVSGMNDAGLSLATFDSYQAKDDSPMFDPQGVPFALLFRQLLEECASLDEVRPILEMAPRTTCMSLVVCDARQAVAFELTPKTVAVRKPEKNVLICTNHFLSPELCVTRECWRYDKLVAYRRQAKPIGCDELAQALHAVNQGEWTLQTMIFEPQSMRLRVSLGNPPSSGQPLAALDVARLLNDDRSTAGKD